ncbi:hypothetical protein [Albibacillus kandeliae]|uniref:hypothetical protein n=1 Tax=Albibacillus kandeliae TaxID=2174228 RepID=UPI000D694343|nr:hypothetical protein [Albibacillus kandeliae]
MTGQQSPQGNFNIVIIGQPGRLQYECLLFAASLRALAPGFTGRLFVATPEAGPLWENNPTLRDGAVLELLGEYGAEVLPFESRAFGQSYPQGNKIEALAHLPEGEPFIFFDSDTLVTGDLGALPLDFTRPTASMRREGTWPEPTLYGPGYGGIWQALYDRFGLDFTSSLDLSQPDEYWERYLYFNAGWFLGPCPRQFGARFLDYATSIRDDPPVELTGQSLAPWLDQVALPLVIHALGGGRPTPLSSALDGEVACHYRFFPLLYARENDRVVEVLEQVTAPNRLKKVLKSYEPIKRMVYQGRGAKVRALFDRDALPRTEKAIRNRIKANGFWMR